MGCCTAPVHESKKKVIKPLINDESIQQHIDQLFALYDKDNNGVMDPSEVKSFLTHMFQNNPHTITDEEVQTFMKSVDGNRDGSIQKREFFAFYKKFV